MSAETRAAMYLIQRNTLADFVRTILAGLYLGTPVALTEAAQKAFDEMQAMQL